MVFGDVALPLLTAAAAVGSRLTAGRG